MQNKVYLFWEMSKKIQLVFWKNLLENARFEKRPENLPAIPKFWPKI
jgi:hypothetical protein